MTKVPERMCVACRTKRDKKELIRLVIHQDKVAIDNKKQVSGRGFYLCNTEECIHLLKKRRVLNRLLSRAVADEEFDELKASINEKK